MFKKNSHADDKRSLEPNMNFNNHITKEHKRKFKGIWCEAYLWFYTGINVMEKMFYLEIDSLDNDNGCFASNDHFSKFSGLSKNRCSEIIKSLEAVGAITIAYTYKIKEGKKTKEVDKRILRVIPEWERNIRNEYEKQCDVIADEIKARKATEPPEEPGKVEDLPPFEKPNTPFEKPNTPFGKPNTPFGKPKDKEYSLKNTSLNNSSSSSKNEEEEEKTPAASLSSKLLTTYKDYRGIKRLGKAERELLEKLVQEHGEEKVLKAIEVGVRKSKDNSFSYIEAVCINGVYGKGKKQSVKQGGKSSFSSNMGENERDNDFKAMEAAAIRETERQVEEYRKQKQLEAMEKLA